MAIPHFSRSPNFLFFALFCATCSLAYLVLGFAVPAEWAVAGQIIFFLAPAAWFGRRFGASIFFETRQFAARAVIIILSMTVLSCVLNGLLPHWERIFPMPIEFREFFERLTRKGEPFGLAKDFFTLVLIPSICEEFFFRGVMQTGLCGRFKPKYAVILASAVFAISHLNPWYLLFYFILGLVFGMIFLRTKNLGLAILAHITNNAIGIVSYYYS